MPAKKKATLVERAEAVLAECESEVTRLAEKHRNKGEPGPARRLMWMNMAGGNIVQAYLIAAKE